MGYVRPRLHLRQPHPHLRQVSVLGQSHFTALKNDLVSRVFPLTELGPLVTFFLATAFLGEPFSPQRLLGTGLIIAGIFLIR
ncbi:MAG TPA: EamA family transporter [Chloroflexota bacterium]|nr:EamA family transporter [Chloroflexota bacterium]